MWHVPLEVPLGTLPLGGLLQRDHACTARVQVFHEPLDGAALTRGVPSLEENDMPRAGALAPVLQFEQLDLQQPLLEFVLVAAHPLVVRVVLPPGVYRDTIGRDQYRVVVIVVIDGVALRSGGNGVGHRRKLTPAIVLRMDGE